ncbi:MAG: histidinol-phosphate transaminase [Candidatus Diapherotrites archaeon]|nr:histidinol-phosphate transaminase [Candidatus Diapherotrites archaeon]
MGKKPRKCIEALKPYVCARSLFKKGVMMDANENSIGSAVSNGLNRYPDPACSELKNALSEYVGVPAENIFVGNGSDECIDLLVKCFVEADENVVVLEPTYAMYRVAAESYGVEYRSCLLDEGFQIDFAELEGIVDRKTKLVFCCSPNNPTGNSLESVLEVAKRLDAIVVVDEAYAEFSGKGLAADAVGYDNLVVLRTFSKAWGLAGARVGYLVAAKRIVECLDKAKLPYNVSAVSQRLALGALKNKGKMLAMVEEITRERERMAQEIRRMGGEAFASEANFVLFRFNKNARQIQERLARKGIVIRDRSGLPRTGNCLRVTVGGKSENDEFLKRLGLAVADAVIFDIDGVLVDVSSSYREAILRTVEWWGGQATNGDISRLKGLGFNNDWDVTYALAKKTTGVDRGDPDYSLLKQKFQELYLGGLIDKEKKIVKPEMLDRLVGYRLGIATGRPRAEALYCLKGFIPKYFREGCIVALEDCGKEKPDPTPLLKAKKALGCKAPVYVGDTASDELAAKAANMPCIIVGRDIEDVNELPEAMG